jgi:uncharacterized protein DUF4437
MEGTMNKLALAVLGTAALATGALAGPKDAVSTPSKDQKWTPLDPKAGDKGPQVSVVFGDMKKKAPIGFFLKIPKDFKPGPHTHASDDYAVVVSGKAHNFPAPGTDEGPAVDPGGSWFQPGGKPHDNHCEAGSECVIFVYMPNGFDIKPWTDPKAPKKDEPKKPEPKK